MTPSQQAFLDSEDNIKIYGGATMALPNKFKFTSVVDFEVFSAKVDGNTVEVSWDDALGNTRTVCHALYHVEDMVSSGNWEIIEESKDEHKNFLSKIKEFVNETGSEVVISKDGYNVFYEGVAGPAVAETDEELEEVMGAILTWYNADTKLKDAAYILQQYAETYE